MKTCQICGREVTDSQLAHAHAIYTENAYYHTDCLDDQTRINLTQHQSLPAQQCAGRSEEQERAIRNLLTFTELPDLAEITDRAVALADLAAKAGATEAMIGGAPYLMPALDLVLRTRGIEPLYAFSLRESVDEEQSDGSIVKRTRFVHAGFVRLTEEK